MSLKLKFVEQARAPGANIAALCREYGISRQTGHKWLRRYHEHGPLGLVEQSRRPRSSPLSQAEDIVAAIVELRDRRPSWGPDKIARVLAVRFGREAPSRSTVARVLKRLGKVKRRRPLARLWTVDEREHVEVRAPNELWTIDFKGWWKADNGQLCEPLTVRDAYSRYVLAAKLVGNKTRGTVKFVLQQLFKEHGVPLAIQCDNGSPWVSLQARGGLTRLSAWLISLGIRLIRSRQDARRTTAVTSGCTATCASCSSGRRAAARRSSSSAIGGSWTSTTSARTQRSAARRRRRCTA